MPRGVEEDAEPGSGLVVVPGRAEGGHRFLARVEVVDDDVEVHLLGHSWPGQSGGVYPSTGWKQKHCPLSARTSPHAGEASTVQSSSAP